MQAEGRKDKLAWGIVQGISGNTTHQADTLKFGLCSALGRTNLHYRGALTLVSQLTIVLSHTVPLLE